VSATRTTSTRRRAVAGAAAEARAIVRGRPTLHSSQNSTPRTDRRRARPVTSERAQTTNIRAARCGASGMITELLIQYPLNKVSHALVALTHAATYRMPHHHHPARLHCMEHQNTIDIIGNTTHIHERETLSLSERSEFSLLIVALHSCTVQTGVLYISLS
jgi:hypothetical protein